MDIDEIITGYLRRRLKEEGVGGFTLVALAKIGEFPARIIVATRNCGTLKVVLTMGHPWRCDVESDAAISLIFTRSSASHATCKKNDCVVCSEYESHEHWWRSMSISAYDKKALDIFSPDFDLEHLLEAIVEYMSLA